MKRKEKSVTGTRVFDRQMCDVEQHREVKTSSSRQLQAVRTSELLERIRGNDPTLRSLRVSPELLKSPEVLKALLRNNSIRSVVFVNTIPKTVSEAAWARFLACLFHLPLHSINAGGGMQLPAHFMRHLLELVEYSCGVGRGCKWLPEESDILNVKAAAPAADGVASAAANFVADDLKAEAALQFLDLSGSHITESHARWLARTLFHPRCSLRHVDLSECLLGTVGLQNLLLEESALTSRLTAEVVAATQIEVLDLRWNGVTEDFGLRVFLDSLEAYSTCITCVVAHGNYLSPGLHQRLAERKARMWPVIVGRRQARHAEAEELKRIRRRRQQAAYSSSYGSVLNLLLSVAAESSSSFPFLHLLDSLLRMEE
ncbi:uncharacterized protein Tco025E_06110 [Trypanosoma conorhini]|uniref:Uncharacterized protein n=1 Tax=Trypanosoma conorhini TaxID=83891 RepID=A0A3R7KS56_9TRYP|nr:uncharacterized protein Tco025E_06110 [Trypanosoma conorhini]RNF14266.1 hypothetical protein Tco025E_06110 [Trypanosoma conorhini]